MKNPLLLFLLLLFYNISFAQNNSTISQLDSQPITTKGISLPQLITTDINRSELQFGVNLSQGLKQPHLTAKYQKFISDKKKQFSLTARAFAAHELSFDQSDSKDFYTFYNMSLSLGANLKLFNDKDYFFEVGSQNSIIKPGDLTNFDFFSASNSISLGIGKGRIDFVNDGTAAVSITEKLEEYGMLTRQLTTEEYSLLTEKIRTLKNRRRFVNRSYPLTETEEIQDLLSSMGVIANDLEITAIIDDVYKFEPMINRTTGSQFRIAGKTFFGHNNFASGFRRVGVSLEASYMINTPISTSWQYNRGVTLYAQTTNNNSSIDDLKDTRHQIISMGIKNDFHYLVDTRMRFSFLSTASYDFVNEGYFILPVESQTYDNKGFNLRTRTEFEYQISRTISTTFGININYSPGNTFTGMSMGLNF